MLIETDLTGAQVLVVGPPGLTASAGCFRRAGAEVIDVGKRPAHHAVPQDAVEQLMVVLEGVA